MEIETTYTVYYMAENMFGTLSQDTLYFDTEKEADEFVLKLMNSERRLYKITKSFSTNYYATMKGKLK